MDIIWEYQLHSKRNLFNSGALARKIKVPKQICQTKNKKRKDQLAKTFIVYSLGTFNTNKPIYHNDNVLERTFDEQNYYPILLLQLLWTISPTDETTTELMHQLIQTQNKDRTIPNVIQ